MPIEDSPSEHDQDSAQKSSGHLQTIHSLIRELDPIDHQILRSRFIDELSLSEIATALALSEGDVRLRLVRVKTSLWRALRDPRREDFLICFSPDLSHEQLKGGMEALADYFRECGGAGFEVQFDGIEIAVAEPSLV